MDQAEQLRNIIKANQNTTRPLARVITVTSGKGQDFLESRFKSYPNGGILCPKET